MEEKIIEIDGNLIESLNDFYNQIEDKFTENLGWSIGRNESALNDILRGGFGVFDDKEKIIIRWVNSEKSAKTLGLQYTIERLTEIMESDEHPFKNDETGKILQDAQNGIGETMFQVIVKIIEKNGHKLELK